MASHKNVHGEKIFPPWVAAPGLALIVAESAVQCLHSSDWCGIFFPATRLNLTVAAMLSTKSNF
jgi:hypothetical protein